MEKAALSDDYFIKRKLYPNVDFYSGLIYRYDKISFIVLNIRYDFFPFIKLMTGNKILSSF